MKIPIKILDFIQELSIIYLDICSNNAHAKYTKHHSHHIQNTRNPTTTHNNRQNDTDRFLIDTATSSSSSNRALSRQFGVD